MTRILLIDGNSLTYRAYFGTAYSSAGIMKTSKGIPTNAVFTVNSMIMNAINKYEPTHVLVAFDAGKMTRRHSKYPEYKAGRNATPSELITQFPIVKEMLQLMRVKIFELSEVEADDIIATASVIFKSAETLVMSSDRDLLQLVDERVSMVIPQSGFKEDQIVTNTNFLDLYGVSPLQIPDLKGIMGDSSDNLPGVKGIGPKGALKLLQEYSTLENIYKNLENITGSTNQKLETSREMALLCKELATLDRNVELPFEMDDLAFKKQFNQELMGFFEKYELKQLTSRFKNMIVDDSFDQIIF